MQNVSSQQISLFAKNGIDIQLATSLDVWNNSETDTVRPIFKLRNVKYRRMQFSIFGLIDLSGVEKYLYSD